MRRNRALLILLFIGVLGGLVYWFYSPTQNQEDSLVMIPTSTITPTPEPTPESESLVTTESETEQKPESPPSVETDSEETSATPVKPTPDAATKSKSSRKKTSPEKSKRIVTQKGQPLMETVEEDSNLGEETADTEGEEIAPEPKGVELTPVTETANETIDDLLGDAQAIVSGFEETDTDEINGVWSGTLNNKKGQSFPVMINRIWDHMTDDYLAPSCFGIKTANGIATGHLRLKTLKFFEKPSKPRSKLIVRLQNKFVMEILSPEPGKRRTTGKAYEVRKNSLIFLGNLNLLKETEATADLDCSYLE
jgi:hypothetical protein